MANNLHWLRLSPHLTTVTLHPKSEDTQGCEPPQKQGGRYGERLEPGLRLGGKGARQAPLPRRQRRVPRAPPTPSPSLWAQGRTSRRAGGQAGRQADGRAGGRA